jgi:hypothetical protein
LAGSAYVPTSMAVLKSVFIHWTGSDRWGRAEVIEVATKSSYPVNELFNC